MRRKNLMLDADEVRELAARLGVSESAAVREVVADRLRHARAIDEAEAALARVDARGGFDTDWEDLTERSDAEGQAAVAAP